MKDNNLCELRQELNLTKVDIAKELNISTSIYCRWENGRDFIPTKRLFELANYYSINIDYMLNITNQRLYIKSNKEMNLDLVKERTRLLRKELDLTLRQIASILNTTSSTWSAYETGKTLILSSFLIEICQSANISIDWVLGRSDNKYLNTSTYKKN